LVIKIQPFIFLKKWELQLELKRSNWKKYSQQWLKLRRKMFSMSTRTLHYNTKPRSSATAKSTARPLCTLWHCSGENLLMANMRLPISD